MKAARTGVDAAAVADVVGEAVVADAVVDEADEFAADDVADVSDVAGRVDGVALSGIAGRVSSAASRICWTAACSARVTPTNSMP